MKHSPLAFIAKQGAEYYDKGWAVWDTDGNWICDTPDEHTAKHIVRACNHFEEMRRTLCFVADAALVPVNISLMAQELLDKLEADE